MNLRLAYALKSAIALVDIVIIATAMYGAYAIRFDFGLDSFYQAQLLSMLPIVVLVRFSALYYSLSYQFLWRYAGISDLVRIIKATIAGLVVLAVINYFRNYPLGLLIAAGFFISALEH